MSKGKHRDTAAASLHHHGPASPQLAARLRRQLIEWARNEGIPSDTTYDIGLASYEAMANTVVHAYPHGTVGPLELHARLDPGAVVVTVADRGTWDDAEVGTEAGAEPDPESDEESDGPGAERPGGRGLDLIRRLSDDSEVVRGEYGTTVRMSWPRKAA
ncbi:MAG: ATP-binding protein [Actinophytocola sp.]|uniref:ATP-binding protein n=1 Tax=Actinophytocola sp. TaxID=1872138 RepID=UPI003D6C0464